MLLLFLELCAGERVVMPKSILKKQPSLSMQIHDIGYHLHQLHKPILTQVILNNTLHANGSLPGQPLSKQTLTDWPEFNTSDDLIVSLQKMTQTVKAIRARVEAILAENKGKYTRQLYDAAQAQATQIIGVPKPVEWMKKKKKTIQWSQTEPNVLKLHETQEELDAANKARERLDNLTHPDQQKAEESKDPSVQWP